MGERELKDHDLGFQSPGQGVVFVTLPTVSNHATLAGQCFKVVYPHLCRCVGKVLPLQPTPTLLRSHGEGNQKWHVGKLINTLVEGVESLPSHTPKVVSEENLPASDASKPTNKPRGTR